MADTKKTATLTLEGTVNVGEGSNTITNITTAATGDQLDPGTVGDDLDEAVFHADLNTQTAKLTGSADLQFLEGVVIQVGGRLAGRLRLRRWRRADPKSHLRQTMPGR